ncbi:phosphatidate cytidylyltransferase [Pelagibacteraceae bacterium]|nr:phosphatidate cytidylyltransferase [Pelagibacteraceae bacterium]
MILSNWQKRCITSLVLLFLIILIFSFNIILIYLLIVLGVLSILEFLQLTKKLSIKFINFYFINIFFIIYVFAFCFMFFFFANLTGLKIILFMLLLACVASDMGGYIFGKVFKGPKLTKISPNKTYSGAAGSIIFSLIVVSFFSYYFLNTLNFTIIIVALVTSIFCQLGDLIFSFLKRKAKLQDTGKILPGHGGVLDRLDGILLAIPFGFIALEIFI